MGILNDLKKLFFGASSVGKTAAGKTSQYVRESKDEIVEEGRDMAEGLKESLGSKTSALKQSIIENSDSLKDRAEKKMKQISEDLSENPVVKKASEVSENVGEKVLSTGDKLLEKSKDVSEKVGREVLDKGQKASEKFKETSEDVGRRILDAKDEVLDKAREAGEEVSRKLNETMDKAEKWAAEEKAKPKKEFADEDLDADGSLLDGSDDFFDKADRYASGDYDSFSEGKITITGQDKSGPDSKKGEPASGFDDLDGDGDEIIDDAIIDEES